MADYSAETNAQIFHTIRLMNILSEHQSIYRKPDQESFKCAIRLCVRESIEAWLREASSHNSQDDGVRSINELILAKQSDIPDLQHLINLKKQPNTWLSHLLRYTDTESAIPQAKEATLIPISPIQEHDEIGELKGLLHEFKEYIQESRSHQVEW